MPISIYNMKTTHFPNITLLITHYNRSESLERLLDRLQILQCSFHEIIVSDDGSKDEHLAKLQLLQNSYTFTLVSTAINKGLGNNINKGQDAVKTPYTLYIQEDFIPKEVFPAKLKCGLEIMEAEQSWDLISFYAYKKYPYLKPFGNGFSEKFFPQSILRNNHLKFYLYSDHPHLRRTNFFKKFGRYKEGINGDKTELAMSLSFIKNNGKALFYDDYFGLLDQYNPPNEPSSASFRIKVINNDTMTYRLLRKLHLVLKVIRLNIQLRKVPIV